MWTPLVLLLVVYTRGFAADQLGANGHGIQPSFEGYLPPTQTYCHPSTIYHTQTQYSTQVIPSTVYNNDVQYITQTDYRTEPVYSTIYSEVVSTLQIPSIVYQTATVTQTKQNIRTQVINLPPSVIYVTRTQEDIRTQVQYQTQYTTRIQQVPTTIIKYAVSTLVVPQQKYSQVYQTQYVTRTQQIPGPTRTVAKTEYRTAYSTVVIPAQDVYLTTTVYRTNVNTQYITKPGQTRYIVSTQLVPITTTIYSAVVLTNTQTQYVTRTQVQQQVSTVYRTQQVPQYITTTVTVPRQVVKTQESTRVVTTTIYSQQIIHTTQYLPANTQYVTNTQIAYSTQYLPGNTRTQYVTNTVYNTNYVTSIYYNKVYHTVTATRTVQPKCNTGYNYQAPSRPFHPY